MSKALKGLPKPIRKQIEAIAAHNYSGDTAAAFKQIVKLGLACHEAVLIPSPVSTHAHTTKEIPLNPAIIAPQQSAVKPKKGKGKGKDKSKEESNILLNFAASSAMQVLQTIGGIDALVPSITKGQCQNLAEFKASISPKVNHLLKTLLANIPLTQTETDRAIVLNYNSKTDRVYIAALTYREQIQRPADGTTPNKDNLTKVNAVSRIVPFSQVAKAAFPDITPPKEMQNAVVIDLVDVIDNQLMPLLIEQYLPQIEAND